MVNNFDHLTPRAADTARRLGVTPERNPFRSILVRAETVLALEEALRIIAGYVPPRRRKCRW